MWRSIFCLEILCLSLVSCAHDEPPTPANVAPLPPLPRSSIAAVVQQRATLKLTDDQVRDLEALDQDREKANAALLEEVAQKQKALTAGSSGSGGARNAPSTGGMNGGGMNGGGMRGGGMRAGGGGGMRGGGMRGGGGRGGGRRSDIRLKHDLVLLGHLDNGLGFYRFDYNGSDKAYVGMIAQEVQTVMPQAVTRDRDGYLRVFYDKLGVTFQTYDHWIASGAQVPAGATR